MALSIEEFNKALQSLEESLELYKTSIEKSKEQKAFRDACVQRFGYCIELAWKTSIKILGSQVKAAKPAIREMARNDLITNPEDWLEYIEARNFTSHTYDEEIAQKVFKAIEQFHPDAKKLFEALKISE